MMRRLRDRQELALFAALHKAAPGLSTAWWALLALRGALPAIFAIATGAVVGAVDSGEPLAGPLAFVGLTFVVLQVLPPLHQAVSTNLGSKSSSWLNDQLMVACVSPPGMGHLERPSLTNDLTMARDFDLGITGPPFSIAMGFIASGLVEMVAGLAAAVVLFGFSWWAPPLLVLAWGSTHWLLRESGVWRDRQTEEVRNAQRHADYAYRLAVDPPAAKELRLFGLSDWVVDRFALRRRRLYDLQWEATRLREKSVLGALAIVLAANVVVFWALADAVADGRIDLAAVSVYLQTAFFTSAIAFGGLSWALDGAAAPVAAVLRLDSAMAPAGALPDGSRSAAGMPRARDPLPRRHVRLRDQLGALSWRASASPSPPAHRWPSSARTGPARRRWPSSCAGCTTLRAGPSRWTAWTCATSSWPRGDPVWPRCSRTSCATSCRCGANVAPNGAPDETITAAIAAAGGAGQADLGHRPGPGLPRRHRPLGRAVAAHRPRPGTVRGAAVGAGVVLLDEPTAQLDVRGEAEIFERVLAATRHCTTILISHRFSTVRLADRICVVEAGPGRRARHPRRADGVGRALPDHVRPPGLALRRGRRARRGGGP